MNDVVKGAIQMMFYETVHPFYTNKGMRLLCHIQLLEKDEVISDPINVAIVMNNIFVNVAESIGKPVDRTTLQKMNEENVIKKSINKQSHHPSVKLINEHLEHQCKFEFKHVSPKEVETILSKLNTKKQQAVMGFHLNLSMLQLQLFQHLYQALLITFLSSVNSQPKQRLLKKNSQLEKHNYRTVSILTC